MLWRHHTGTRSAPAQGAEDNGISYLYWGFTGARFGRSARSRLAWRHDKKAGPPISRQGWAYWLEPRDEQYDNESEEAGPEIDDEQDSTRKQAIARLTAERDAARYERELETNYREALLRDTEMLRAQLEEAQRRVMEYEQAAHDAPQTNERERRLEADLEDAQNRIAELEALVGPKPPVALAPPARSDGDDEMMDVFLQFVGMKERPGIDSGG